VSERQRANRLTQNGAAGSAAVRDLVIAGAGGFARETASAVRLCEGWRLLGFLDDDPALHGQVRSGSPVLGPLAAARDMDAAVVVCIGSPRDYAARARVVDRLGLPPSRYGTVVHPGAQVGSGCALGPGTVLLAGSVLTADVTVGAHVAVMPQVVLTHDDVIEDYVTIASGVRLGGGVRLATGSYAGAGALIRETVSIGAGALVGLGSVVLRDVPPGQVWAGNPARYLKEAPV
jgi:sugar O-acyltransferase (sialic acid O-acetyltransferase NeuD family)